MFSESAIAHRFLDGLKGIEIGAGAHNDFGLDTINIDYDDSTDSIYKKEQTRLCGKYSKVDIVAFANDLPFEDCSWDFVINSHVLEHCYDVLGTLKEWYRVIKPEGYLFMIIPHKERMFDKDETSTTLEELIKRQSEPKNFQDTHHSCWLPNEFKEVIDYLGWNIVEFLDSDDKVGNGFCVIIQKESI